MKRLIGVFGIVALFLCGFLLYKGARTIKDKSDNVADRSSACSLAKAMETLLNASSGSVWVVHATNTWRSLDSIEYDELVSKFGSAGVVSDMPLHWYSGSYRDRFSGRYSVLVRKTNGWYNVRVYSSGKEGQAARLSEMPSNEPTP